MKKNGFTLIEVMIVILIIVILAMISMPVIITNVIRIEEDASIEAAALSLRQFYIDARSKSLISEKVYVLTLVENGEMTFSPTPLTDTNDIVRFTPPSSIRSHITFHQVPHENVTYAYIMGMFTRTPTTSDHCYLPGDENRYFIPENDYLVTLRIDGATKASVNVENGYPKFEIVDGGE